MASRHEEQASYLKVSVVAGVVIRKNGKVLLVQEAWGKVRGKWNLPAGRVDSDETLEEAAVREAKEETGLRVELDQKLLTLHQSVNEPVLHSFLVSKFTGEITFNPSEIMDVRWFDIDAVATMEGLRNEEYIRQSIELAKKQVAK